MKKIESVEKELYSLVDSKYNRFLKSYLEFRRQKIDSLYEELRRSVKFVDFTVNQFGTNKYPETH
jgi:hypothetical protein